MPIFEEVIAKHKGEDAFDKGKKEKKRKTCSQAKQTLCWKCSNAYAHKCDWMANEIPIKGWETSISNNTMRTTRVLKCPNFEKQ